jgi:6-phospho-beta-glucosidase
VTEHPKVDAEALMPPGPDPGVDAERRIAVLGGSSPFTVGLLDAIASDAGALSPAHLVLSGRAWDALELVRAYGHATLSPFGWRVSGTTDLDRALDGADVVVNQIRYGELEGRRRDEHLATDLGVPADETLGPAGLAAAIRIAPGHRDLARALIAHCPQALVLNLANPLSCSTAILHRWGVQEAVGLCELPLVTAREACRILDVPMSVVGWSYAGLNHRGFIHRLILDGRDLLEELPDVLGDRTIGGITAAEIASVGAIPMKHFALRRGLPEPATSRTEFLVEVRRSILDELRADPARTPPSLQRRPQPWYPDAVVPMLAAVGRMEPRTLIVNLPAADGIVREVHAAVSAAGISPGPALPPPPTVSRWIHRFAEHERRILEAALDPGLDTIRAALEADPLVASADVEASTRRVCRDALETGS